MELTPTFAILTGLNDPLFKLRVKLLRMKQQRYSYIYSPEIAAREVRSSFIETNQNYQQDQKLVSVT